ncbi:Glutamine synthetase, catalytic domain [Geodermatophilus pulveris]|uniref:Glutamine synthetase, catalytic domain n=1 Tax=Geodermatophilus pulveris TaxID=1564159 RepID=A0A239C7H6_9ACTN|nr:glutamine synthetase [Geodermatophilus pulveris]SNS15571.1 Glutamine synthetase, catalytic domain [Geodermatophilus pulveris]
MALTSMPEYDGAEGNSCQLHVSLRSPDGTPVLAGDGAHGESALLRRVLAGQLACLRELTLLFAPTVNAYKRLRPGASAPISVAWGPDDRLAALRLVGSGASLRLEHRVPGGDADPHLALAAVLLAARHGIEHDLPLPDPVRGAPGPDAATLPASVAEAADLLDGSAVAREGLGDALVDALVAAARAEWAGYTGSVSEWERARYFERR